MTITTPAPRRLSRRRLLAPTLILTIGSVGTVPLVTAAPAQAAVSISQDAANKTVTLAGARYSAVLNYDNQARISSLKIDNQEVLAATDGIYSFIDNGTVVSSTSLAAAPTVNVTTTTVTLDFATTLVNEKWTLTPTDSELTFKLERTFKAATTANNQGSPAMTFATAAFSDMRWTADGSAWPLHGDLLNAHQYHWLSAGSGKSTGLRAAKEQVSFAMLDEQKKIALDVTGTTSADALGRGRATTISRPAGTYLRADVTVADDTDLTYDSGTPKGYSNDAGDGHVREDAKPVYDEVVHEANDTSRTTLVLRPKDFDPYYDLGDLKGVDEYALARAIDYGRWAIQDTRRGGSTEASMLKAEVPAFEQHWIGQLIETFPNQGSVRAYQGGLEDIRDDLQSATTGDVACCRPGSTTQFGPEYGDQEPGYVLAIVKAYQLSGDLTWLNSMTASARKALDHVHASKIDTTGMVKNTSSTDSKTFRNNYWESSTGTYDGYSTAMYYQALTEWARLEQGVLGKADNATTYQARATTLRTSFNKSLADGGLWSTSTKSFKYGSGNVDTPYLPVNAAVLKTDLATADRRLDIVKTFEEQSQAGNYDMHPMNVMDIYQAGVPAPANNKIGENGGWYGAPEGDYYAGLPLLKDPQVLHNYITAFLTRSQHERFYGMSATERDNWLNKIQGEYWFNTTVMPAWGLYRYGYGFQPDNDALVLAPNISPGMVGSTVKYNWRGNDLTVKYNSRTSFTITASALATNVKIRWINQPPGATRNNQVDGGGNYAMTVNADGIAEGLLNKNSTGTHTFHCTDCTSYGTATASGTSLVQTLDLSGATTRNNTTELVGVNFTTGAKAISVNRIGRYFVPGNKQPHLLKIVNSSGRIVAAGTVDMAAGSADSLGFKYAVLTTPVTLAANTSYRILSYEAKGGDFFYDSNAKITATTTGSVGKATYGRVGTDNANVGNAYGPLNLTYN